MPIACAELWRNVNCDSLGGLMPEPKTIAEVAEEVRRLAAQSAEIAKRLAEVTAQIQEQQHQAQQPPKN